ncbi:capsular biosynthesis protein [Caballeronia sp. INDeC2]|uniref:capsule biosynthesis protein n=1 Tax=Caballeronia sp. INDeC2 TaxID=2921747 RepID=UPI002028C395|nr:capsular biosynthesis protein [Caballeronia sp. INDeC2]
MTSTAQRYAKLDELGKHGSVLLLQGPNGPFFKHLAKRLRANGTTVMKVNFNGGDSLFFCEKSAIRYRGAFEEWSTFFTVLVKSNSVKAIALFGQWRPVHQVAIAIARELRLKIFVFEEGYARPWWITLEENGVNDASSLISCIPDKLPVFPQIARPVRFRFAFTRMAMYSYAYFAFGVLCRRSYPHYVHHKPFRPWETLYWIRSACKKLTCSLNEKGMLSSLLDPYGPDFFLVPLQISTDSQIVHSSPWENNEAFVEATIRSFARHAVSTDVLVFKHHPLERGHADYGRFIHALAAEEGIAERVKYIHVGHVPSLLKRCKGAVTVNSTAGLQALYHGVPLCVTGKAFFARPGLVSGKNIDAFWQDPVDPNRKLFTRFYRYMMHTTQINASFYVSKDLVKAMPGCSLLRLGRRLTGCGAALVVFGSSGSGSVIELFVRSILDAFRA